MLPLYELRAMQIKSESQLCMPNQLQFHREAGSSTHSFRFQLLFGAKCPQIGLCAYLARLLKIWTGFSRIPSRRGQGGIAQSKASCDIAAFASSSLWGKFGGGLHACGATFLYIVPLPNIFLTRLFSKQRLKRKDFQEIARLAWAQEVPSSHLGAPTNHFLVCLSATLNPFHYGRIAAVEPLPKRDDPGVAAS